MPPAWSPRPYGRGPSHVIAPHPTPAGRIRRSHRSAITTADGGRQAATGEGEGQRFDETLSRIVRRTWVQFAKTGDPSLAAETLPDGKARAWPVYDGEDRYVMRLDEFDVHAEKESGRQIVDWDRRHFLTKHYRT